MKASFTSCYMFKFTKCRVNRKCMNEMKNNISYRVLGIRLNT